MLLAEGKHNIFKSHQLLECVCFLRQKTEEPVKAKLWMIKANVDDEAMFLQQAHHKDCMFMSQLIRGKGDRHQGIEGFSLQSI